MSKTTTPVYTDNVSVIAAATLARLGTARGTIDLRTKYGAWLFFKIGRGGTTALTNGIDILVRRVLNNDVATPGGRHPAGVQLAMAAPTTACNGNTTVAATSAAGQNEILTAGVANFAAGDLICITDAAFTRLEWSRVSKLTVAVGTGLTLSAPLQYTHTLAQADTVRNKADVLFPLWIDGGSLWEVIFDYGDDAAGDNAIVQVLAQSFDSQTIV